MADDADKKPSLNPTVALYWREIERYNRATSDWYKEAADIEDLYLDDSRITGSSRRFAMLWANVETLKPAVYAKPPIYQCSRRYKDRDPIARVASEVMERATNTSFELYGVDEVFKAVRDDRLLAGRGQAWARYEAVIEQYEDETIDGETGEPVMGERLADEQAVVDYVRWKDFGHNMCGTWKDVYLVWRCVFKTEEEMIQRFGGEKAAKISYNAKAPAYGSGGDKDDPDGRCKVYELWDKQRGIVSWMVEGAKDFLETGPPPTNFRKFFPCPEPWYATKTSKQLIPTPDYCYYKDQAKEINDLTDKIGNMEQFLMIKAFTPATSNEADPLEEAVRDTSNKELFQQVVSHKEWSEKGGASKLVDFFPVDIVAKALDYAIKLRAQLIQDVFQITGVSDILRGQTDARETLGAQQLKAQTGFSRLRNAKDEGARFCKEVGQLCAEIIAEQFSPETLARISGFKYVPQQMGVAPMMMPTPGMIQPTMPMPPNVTMMPGVDPRMAMGANGGPPMQDANPDDAQTFGDEVIALLRDDQMRNFRIDVETDSTVQADEQAEKAARMEMVGVAGEYLERMAKMVQQAPALAPIAGEMLMFAVRGFRAGRQMEEALERGFAQLVEQVKQQQSQPPPPDPRMIAAQTNAQVQESKLKLQAQNDQARLQLDARKQQQDAALAIRKQDIDAAIDSRQNDLDAHAKARDHAERQLSGGSST